MRLYMLIGWILFGVHFACASQPVLDELGLCKDSDYFLALDEARLQAQSARAINRTIPGPVLTFKRREYAQRRKQRQEAIRAKEIRERWERHWKNREQLEARGETEKELFQVQRGILSRSSWLRRFIYTPDDWYDSDSSSDSDESDSDSD